MTLILQPLDVEDQQGLEQLAELVDRLEIVPAPSRTPARRWIDVLSGWVYRRQPSGSGRHIDDWCWTTTRVTLRRVIAEQRPLAILTEYALLSKCLEDVPSGILKIIDTVEVFFRNQDRFRVEGLEAPMICTPSSEKTALARGDVLMAIQKNDADSLREVCPGKRVIMVPYSLRQPLAHREGPHRGAVLYVGSSNVFNIHGLREFVRSAWPAIARRIPDASLRIVGSVPVEVASGDPRIVHLGRLTDDQLAREYATATVVINPQVAGTGLKIKCVEALSAGCPLVTTAAGADGLEDGAGKAYRLAESWPDFIEHVVTLLVDGEARGELEVAAKEFADRVFSPKAVFAELGAVLDDARSSHERC